MASVKRAYEVLFKEKRLPYSWERRWQSALYERALQRCLNQVFSTPPIACNRESLVELHVQTSARDLAMATLALKSLLRFVSDFAVIVHGDKTFDSNCAHALRKHVPGVRLIDAVDAERLASSDPMVEPIRDRFLHRFDLPKGFENRAPSRQQKIFDLHLSSERETIMYLDSDTLFLQFPQELVDWMEGKARKPFHARPRSPNLNIDRELLREVFPGMNAIEAFNSGLFGFRKADIPFHLVVDVASTLLEHPEVPIFGDESVWRLIYGFVDCECLEYAKYPLFTTGTAYRELIKNSELRYLHFLGKHKDGVYRTAANLVLQELSGAS